ncbi:MAG: hypothetical protein WC292_07785 [Clostridia bacterium]
MLESTQNLLIALLVVVVIILLLNLYMLSKLKRGAKPSAEVNIPAPPNSSGIDPATVAAITTAISCMLDGNLNNNSLGANNVPKAKFIVKSIKKA